MHAQPRTRAKSTNLSAATVARQQLLRPYPQFTGISVTEPDGYSWYHSLQVLGERRFQNGFTAQFNWVWSKFMEANSFRNDSDPLPEKLISDLDRTHVFHFSGINELPFGRGKPLLSGGGRLMNALVGGWQGSASWQHISGAPLGFGDALHPLGRSHCNRVKPSRAGSTPMRLTERPPTNWRRTW